MLVCGFEWEFGGGDVLQCVLMCFFESNLVT